MTALLLVGIVSWRRLANAPKLMLTTPYLVFAALCVVTFGVAFASIGNLGILTRQRSLVLPLLLVFWCLPPIVFASERAEAATEARTDARVRAADQASRTPAGGTAPLARALSAGSPPMTDGRTLGIDWTPGEVPALLGLTAIAIYGCVPETDQMPAIGVMLAALFVIELITRTPSAPVVHAVADRHRAVVGPLRGDRAGVGHRRRAVRVLAARARRDRVSVAGPPAAAASACDGAIGLIGGIAAVAVARTGALEPTIGPALLAVAIAAAGVAGGGAGRRLDQPAGASRALTLSRFSRQAGQSGGRTTSAATDETISGAAVRAARDGQVALLVTVRPLTFTAEMEFTTVLQA